MSGRATAAQLVRSVVYYAERHPTSDHSIQALAERTGLSVFYFQRVFRSIMGESVKQFSLRVRLQGAALQLKTSDIAIARIAEAAGFGTHAGFTKAFNRSYGVSPMAFRRGVEAYSYTALSGQQEPGINDDNRPVVVRFVWYPTRLVVALRYVGPTEGVQDVWLRLVMWAHQQGLWRADVACFGFHYDDWRKGERPSYRYDAAIEIDLVVCERLLTAGEVVSNVSWPSFAPPSQPPKNERRRMRNSSSGDGVGSELSILSIPGGCFAVADFEGSLSEYDGRWWWLMHQWLPPSGYALRTAYVLDQYPASQIISQGNSEQLVSTSCLPLTRTR